MWILPNGALMRSHLPQIRLLTPCHFVIRVSSVVGYKLVEFTPDVEQNVRAFSWGRRTGELLDLVHCPT